MGASYYDSSLRWFENDGTGIFTEHLISSAVNEGQGVILADLDSEYYRRGCITYDVCMNMGFCYSFFMVWGEGNCLRRRKGTHYIAHIILCTSPFPFSSHTLCTIVFLQLQITKTTKIII